MVEAALEVAKPKEVEDELGAGGAPNEKDVLPAPVVKPKGLLVVPKPKPGIPLSPEPALSLSPDPSAGLEKSGTFMGLNP